MCIAAIKNSWGYSLFPKCCQYIKNCHTPFKSLSLREIKVKMSDIKLNTIPEAIEDLKNGKIIIVVDDENRENEGDFLSAAELTTPEIINFMAKYGRGLICLPMAPDMADALQLPLMTQRNGSRFGTNFTVSIEAREGVTTGISAADRARTILTAVADGAQPDDLVTPGHIFPLRAHPGGVLMRAGQTEGSVDLA